MATEELPKNHIPSDSKGWKCGDTDYQYPIGKPKDDPWDVLFKNLSDQDKSQCKAWREEVKNLLIFAGLFAAVITPFVVETYKTLLPDPNDTIISVLSVIASRIGDGGNPDGFNPVHVSDPFQAHFVPTATSVRVNIFFLLSLVLGLSTALICIVCLQWLTQHQTYPETFSSEQKFALLHMRIGAFQRWKVPEIFTSLPVLIQAALILFLIGLADFLWNIDHVVIIPVGILIAITLLFLVLTTVLPALQVFALKYPYPQIKKEVPVECPYSSPQAAAFCHLVASSSIISTLCSFIFASVFFTPFLVHGLFHKHVKPESMISSLFNGFYGQLVKPSMLFIYSRSRAFYDQLIQPYQWLVSYLRDIFQQYRLGFYLGPGEHTDETKDTVKESWAKLDERLDHLLNVWTENSWVKFDAEWMYIRDTYFRYGCEPSSWLFRKKEENDVRFKHYYDSMHGIQRVIDDNFALEDESLIFAAFHSAQALPVDKIISGKKFSDQFIPNLKTRNHYLSKILRYNKD